MKLRFIKKINLKKIIHITSLLLLAGSISAFNWPQQSVEYNSFTSYFGQRRGHEISKSIIFRDPAEVTAIEDGEVLIIMTEENDMTDFFPTTLGTSLVLSHEDGLISVYGNLDTDSFAENYDSNKVLYSNSDVISFTGNTGWQDQRSNLEFQILDTKSNAAINPKLFMPRTENELNLSISNICLINKTGDFFYLDLHNTLNSGIYKVYQKRNPIASPYKTSISINGVTIDQVSYDRINTENGKLYVNGKKKYINADIYPNAELSLLGEITLTPGRSTLGLTVEDFTGDKRSTNYTLTIFN